MGFYLPRSLSLLRQEGHQDALLLSHTVTALQPEQRDKGDVRHVVAWTILRRSNRSSSYERPPKHTHVFTETPAHLR